MIPTTPVSPPVAKVVPAPEKAMVLVFNVPEDAVVFLADKRMKTTGSVRRFRVPLPEVGRSYQYPVRVELTRNGETLKSESTQTVSAGQTLTVVVNEAGGAVQTASLK